MSNPYFKFKYFTVYHDKCAMKVGTDGVLLGAWASISNCRNVVDVGTGSGLIALMLAQRNPEIRVLGIDIDANAALQASENFISSPFSKRLEARNSSFDEWVDSSREKVDAIISNPPFFATSLQSPDVGRTLARHNDTLPLQKLFAGTKRKLTDNGLLSLILPYNQKIKAVKIAESLRFSLSRITTVYPTPNSQPKRVLLEFVLQSVNVFHEDEIVIEKARHEYSSDFVSLLKDFYLDF